jgi:3-methyladenine DNA glycosylase AlkD
MDAAEALAGAEAMRLSCAVMTEALDIAAEHAGLVAQLRAAGTPYRGGQHNDSYSGSGHPFFNVSAPHMRRIGRAWLAAHRKASDAELLAVVASLFTGEAYEEKVLAAILLAANARMRRLGTPTLVDGWLGHLQGWAEIDSLCASVFGPDELEADWRAWRDLIRRLSRDSNINRRRAALVLLTRATRTSSDPRYGDLAFEVIEQLKGERPILITKAVSWLLRSMANHHGAAVASYLDANAATLPAIAVRETRVKLATGTKSGRRRSA